MKYPSTMQAKDAKRYIEAGELKPAFLYEDGKRCLVDFGKLGKRSYVWVATKKNPR